MAATSGDLLREEFSDRVILVTGGGSGIGAAISEGFGALGARVAIQYHQTDTAHIAALAGKITAAGGDLFSIQADFSRSEEVLRVISMVQDHYGRIDVLINNAGSMVERRRLAELDDAFIDQVFDLNARSVITATQAVLPLFEKQGGGSIINLSSISAITGGSPGSSVYSASKAFVSTLTRSLARELAEQNVRVNALSPGTIDTAFHVRFSSAEKLEKTRSSIPLQRLGLAQDCAGTAIYLASERLSGYVTGQVIEVNGGQFMG